MPEEFWANAVFSLIPTILVGAIFWFVMRAIFRADRTERKVYAQVEAEERARMGMPAAPVAGAGVSVTAESDLVADPAHVSKPSA